MIETVIGFVFFAVALSVGFMVLNRVMGSALGVTTLRNTRLIQVLYETGGIPESWVRDAPDRRTAVRCVDARIKKLLRHIRTSPVFSDAQTRSELIGALTEIRERIEEVPIDDLLIEDPRLRRTVVIATARSTTLRMSPRRLRRTLRALALEGYTTVLLDVDSEVVTRVLPRGSLREFVVTGAQVLDSEDAAVEPTSLGERLDSVARMLVDGWTRAEDLMVVCDRHDCDRQNCDGYDNVVDAVRTIGAELVVVDPSDSPKPSSSCSEVPDRIITHFPQVMELVTTMERISNDEN